MAVTIVPISKKKDIRRFVQFGNDLYKDCPQYCPPLFGDEVDTFNTKKNPVFDVAECQLFLAMRGERIVGRVAAIINHRANEHWGVKKVRFGWIDFIDDKEVSRALLDAVAAWGKAKGMNILNGPVGFTDLDKEGLLIEGYEYLAPLASLYNYPYYAEHLEAYGLTKENDWIEIQIYPGGDVPERAARIAKIVAQRGHYSVAKVRNVKELLKRFGYSYFDVIDQCYQQLYNFQPLTQRQKEYYSKYYFSILNFDFVTLVVNEKDEIVGFGIGMPDISEACRRCGGKLFPFGWYHLLKALKAKKMEHFDLLLIGVRPDLQGTGINAMIIAEQYPYFLKYGIKTVETTSIMESNWKNQANWEMFPHKQHKRRRAYAKEI
ncbi:MAG: N-acetyltransferase [Paludibacteraceae bacterium]|nr:N-acetyltransferase [Paludibacteraceae bacterium]